MNAYVLLLFVESASQFREAERAELTEDAPSRQFPPVTYCGLDLTPHRRGTLLAEERA